jgi:hypothetical protein
MRKSGRLMRESCYGPCFVFRTEAEATLGAYEGAVKAELDPGSDAPRSHTAGRKDVRGAPVRQI